jgi:pimeloyl-ACP methyl ester carboxylesterase
MSIGYTAHVALLVSIGANAAEQAGAPRDYRFRETISRPVLENYLSRSISMEGILNGRGDLDDNIRMLKSTGAKFIDRSICLWGGEANLLRNLERAKQQVPKLHAADPEMILQACVFEIVTTQVEQVPIPDWAFTALGRPVEQRNFRYADMIYPPGQRRDWPRNGSVPDVSRPETKLWFYFLAASYIDLGFEAIHFGQVEIMNRNDKDLAHWSEVLSLVRAYAKKRARRGLVLCDGHVPSGGLARNGALLLDFHSFPLRIMEVPDRPQEAILQVGFSDGIYGKSKGGTTPSGWKCNHLPYLVEIDNFGASRNPGQSKQGGIWVWGYDEVTWFAHQPAEYRNNWLRYAWDWVRKTDPNGFLQMPGSRTLSSRRDSLRWYYANNKSDTVPEGFGQEDTIRAIWASETPTSSPVAEADNPLVPFTGEKSEWHEGFDRYDYVMEEQSFDIQPFKRDADERSGVKPPPQGKRRCVVVVPKTPAQGNPWSWRGVYWDHEPQTEVELLRRGFHVVYISPAPDKAWDAWYQHLTAQHGLAKKTAFIGMSLGGVYAYDWSTANPDKVACIYADNPAIHDEAFAKLSVLAKSGVALLNVCGNFDFLLERHTLAIESRYHQLGGRISVVIKEGAAHHPHSLRNPNLIADWIVKYAADKDGTRASFADESFTKSYYYSAENIYHHLEEEHTYATCRGPGFVDCYDRYDSKTKSQWGIGGAGVIVPKRPAAGMPWVFRADPIPPDATVDQALLARGFHIVCAPIVTQAGPVREQWDAVYKLLADHGFATKAVMEGSGSAAGEVYAWAVANADKVACVYAENPAFRSLMSKEPLLDQLGSLAKAQVPLIHVCGEDDPWLNEHTRAAEKRYKELGGSIAVIVKQNAGHYPLGPKDPKAIAELIARIAR